MIVWELLIAASLVVAGDPCADVGVIGGIVLDASDRQSPLGGVEVVLRVDFQGQFVPVEQTTTDAQGRFCFEQLPVGGNYLYLPGANRAGVHYPGRRIRLTAEQPRADATLTVCEAIAEPNPLVVRRHEVDIRPEPGALKVTETLLVDNPTSKCYVGRADRSDGQPVTLGLSIPSDFERTTFDKEFFGREFSLVDGKLVTRIPWTPGKRELTFTYVLPIAGQQRVWQRPLDLPTSHVRVRVHTPKPEEIDCSLNAAEVRRVGEQSEATFESNGSVLPAGNVIRVALGHLPIPWMFYGRWAALGVLVAMIGTAVAISTGRKNRAQGPPARTDATPTEGRATLPHRRGRSTRRRRKGRQYESGRTTS